MFIDKSQSERKETLSQFIGVDIFDKLYQLASDENRDNATLIRKFKSDDFTQKLADIDTRLKENKNDYKLLELNQKALNEEDELLNKRLLSLNEKIVKLNSDSGVSIEELEKRLNNLKNKKESVEKQKTSLQERLDHREKLHIDLDEILDKFDEEDLEEGITKLKRLQTDLTHVDTEIEKVNIKLESLYERKQHLDSHKYNEECDICMENSKSILETKSEVETKIKDGEGYLQDFEKQKLDLNIEIDSLKSYEKEWENLKEAKEKEDKIDREISTLINKLSTTET